MVYGRECSSWVVILCPSSFYTKHQKNLRTSSKNLGFSSPV